MIYDSLEDGSSQVCFGGTFIDKRLYIRFGKHSASGGNGIDLLVMRSCLIESCCIGLEKVSHLIDKGTGPAGTDTVHPLVQTVSEVDDFCIFSAEFNGYICLRRCKMQSGSNGNHFLLKGNAKRFSQIDRAGSCNTGFHLKVSDFLFGIHKKLF